MVAAPCMCALLVTYDTASVSHCSVRARRTAVYALLACLLPGALAGAGTTKTQTSTPGQGPFVDGEFLATHMSGFPAVHDLNIANGYGWKAVVAATGADGTSADPAGTIVCANTLEMTEVHMSISESLSTVAWPCYIATSGTPIRTTTQRGINYFTAAGVILNLAMSALAYAFGVMRSAVSDDAGGFYVSLGEGGGKGGRVGGRFSERFVGAPVSRDAFYPSSCPTPPPPPLPGPPGGRDVGALPVLRDVCGRPHTARRPERHQGPHLPVDPLCGHRHVRVRCRLCGRTPNDCESYHDGCAHVHGGR